MKSIDIVLLVGLLICSWKDVRSHMISLPFVIFWTCLLCGMQIYQKNIGIALVAGSFITLGIASLISYFTNGKMGMGDGFLFAMAVMGLGIVRSCYMFIYCFTGAFVVAVILVVVCRKERDSRIPLAPFILAGSMLTVL